MLTRSFRCGDTFFEFYFHIFQTNLHPKYLQLSRMHLFYYDMDGFGALPADLNNH